MKKSRAIKIAIECMEKVRQKSIYNANPYRIGVAPNDSMMDKYERMDEAITILVEAIDDAITSLEHMTTDEFSQGADKRVRDDLKGAIRQMKELLKEK